MVEKGENQCQQSCSDLRCAGLATILIERGLISEEAASESWCRKNKMRGVCDSCKNRSAFDPDREGRTDCCMRRMLASQPDFLKQKNRITELLESEGFLVMYVPKFHPELNRTLHHANSIRQLRTKPVLTVMLPSVCSD